MGDYLFSMPSIIILSNTVIKEDIKMNAMNTYCDSKRASRKCAVLCRCLKTEHKPGHR